MEKKQKMASTLENEQYAAKIFYFCYCILGTDRIGAEKASRCVLEKVSNASKKGRSAEMHSASLALRACANIRPLDPETTEKCLFRIFRFSASEIAHLTGRSAEDVARVLQKQDDAGESGIPLLPLLEGECLAACKTLKS